MIIQTILILFNLIFPGDWEKRPVDIPLVPANHYQYKFDDGSNVGFFGGPKAESGKSSGDGPGGLHSDSSSQYTTASKSFTVITPAATPMTGKSVTTDSGHRDDAIMSKAIESVAPKYTEESYKIGRHDCQNFKKDVDKKYVEFGGEIK
ncbi:hypothetical protein FACS1894152_8360 [Bacilli bacterium]|nr:hypothetical protein FACS1894152_8360 [Bacilli bacterium]